MKKILLILIFAVAAFFWIKKEWRTSDYKLGIITPTQVAILSVSPSREMVNVLILEPMVKVWIPGGMGWYQSDKINKIAETEKKPELIDNIFYYNFGFVPDKVVYLKDVNEWRNWNSVKYWGTVEWLRYKFFEEEWLFKSEDISQDLIAGNDKLKEILPRDFADSELSTGELRISVFNASGQNALGSFMADRLNWMGFEVMEVNSAELINNCEVMVKNSADKLTIKYAEWLSKMFKCSQISNNSLLNKEILLYLGQNYASMIKYDSYQK
ncbi:MAG: LytR C-terminal domain-containing protein [Candidatus Shapirobacteria bacterium]|jgi:hypothetical protein